MSFSPVWCRHFSLWAFLTHCIHRHSSHFAFIIHWDSLDFTQPTLKSAFFVDLLSSRSCYRCNLSSSFQSSLLHGINIPAHCSLFLFQLLGGGSTSQYQLARPTGLTTTPTHERTELLGRTKTNAVFLLHHICIPINLTTHTMISRIYPFTTSILINIPIIASSEHPKPKYHGYQP